MYINTLSHKRFLSSPAVLTVSLQGLVVAGCLARVVEAPDAVVAGQRVVTVQRDEQVHVARQAAVTWALPGLPWESFVQVVHEGRLRRDVSPDVGTRLWVQIIYH